MNELIKVNSDTQTVSARELHEKLGIKTEFRKWFPRMCGEYGFEVGKDFKRVYQKCPTLGGKQEMVDYEISIEMAKELCMIQRTPIGKQIRKHLMKF
jgi:anti-repressor protein